MARKNVGKSGETGERSVDHDMMLQSRSENNDQEKFAQYVKAHGAESQFLTLEDERHLLRAAVARFDISFDEARWLASGILLESGVALESDLDSKIEGVLQRFAKTGKKVTKAEFEDAVAIYRIWAKKGIGNLQVREKLKRIIENNPWKVGRSRYLRSRRWFRKIDSD